MGPTVPEALQCGTEGRGPVGTGCGRPRRSSRSFPTVMTLRLSDLWAIFLSVGCYRALKRHWDGAAGTASPHGAPARRGAVRLRLRAQARAQAQGSGSGSGSGSLRTEARPGAAPEAPRPPRAARAARSPVPAARPPHARGAARRYAARRRARGRGLVTSHIPSRSPAMNEPRGRGRR